MAQTTIAGGGVFTAKNVSDLNSNFNELYSGGTLSGLTLAGTTTVSGTLTVTGTVSSTAISATASTLTVTAATHAGRIVVLNRAAGITVTLPAASGSGNIYRFLVGTTASGGNYVIQVASNTDYFRGYDIGVTDTAGTAMAWSTANTGTVATESDTITMNGTTQGGRIGDSIEIIDLAANVFAVRITAVGSGTEATPFSVAV